jgi:hypothetical protein
MEERDSDPFAGFGGWFFGRHISADVAIYLGGEFWVSSGRQSNGH